jgi:hypothetical protein
MSYWYKLSEVGCFEIEGEISFFEGKPLFISANKKKLSPNEQIAIFVPDCSIVHSSASGIDNFSPIFRAGGLEVEKQVHAAIIRAAGNLFGAVFRGIEIFFHVSISIEGPDDPPVIHVLVWIDRNDTLCIACISVDALPKSFYILCHQRRTERQHEKRIEYFHPYPMTHPHFSFSKFFENLSIKILICYGSILEHIDPLTLTHVLHTKGYGHFDPLTNKYFSRVLFSKSLVYSIV